MCQSCVLLKIFDHVALNSFYLFNPSLVQIYLKIHGNLNQDIPHKIYKKALTYKL